MAIDHIPLGYIFTSSSNRESGFYWVVFNGDWIVAEWVKGIRGWDVPGYDGKVSGFKVTKIDERRIINPNE